MDFKNLNEDYLSFNKREVLTLRNSKILCEKAESSTCRIDLDKGYGTGFFCKIKYPNEDSEIYCLITNDHVITKDMLLTREKIEIQLNNKNKEIFLYLYRRIWNDNNMDFTCIEII